MGRLRVSVCAPKAAGRTGHGRVWERGLAELGELVLYIGVTIAAILLFERDLLREARGYLVRTEGTVPSVRAP